MSSTNRAAVRNPQDYYVTPQWAILDLLDALCADAGPELGFDIANTGLIVLDPCAGGDAGHGMAYPEAIAKHGKLNVQSLITLDIREDSLALHKADYLYFALGTFTPDIIITNPPFNLALPIIQKALRDVRTGGLVVMLQRLNFFGSEERSTWMKSHMPALTYVHAKRLRFHDKGAVSPKTGKPLTGDSIEYAHFVWQRGNHPRFSKTRII